MIHLKNWLKFYPASQLVIIDGEKLKKQPVDVMNKFQRDIKMTSFIDYKERLIYDKDKGFYCQIVGGRTKCLGKEKGRKYEEMDQTTLHWLQNYYKQYNEDLIKLLKSIGADVPDWLESSNITKV